MNETYYDRLGVEETASAEEIDKAYRDLVKEVHPDQNDDPDASDQFIKIKKAYDILSDPRERETYDNLGHERYVQNETGTTDQSHETDTVTVENADWSAHVRDSPAGSHLQDSSSQTPHPEWTDSSLRSDIEAGLLRWVAVYSVLIVSVFVISTLVFGGALDVTGSESSDPVVETVGGWAGLTALAIIAFISVITISEWLLNTPQRFSPTAHQLIEKYLER